MTLQGAWRTRRGRDAFSLVETTVGMMVFGICFVALLSGMTGTVSTVESSRETIRASQIMNETLDTIRLYSWQKVTTPNYIAPYFTATQYPTNGTGCLSPGIIYTGRVTIANAPITESYQAKMRLVTVEVTWTWQRRLHRTQMSTLVGEYGLQTYIY